MSAGANHPIFTLGITASCRAGVTLWVMGTEVGTAFSRGEHLTAKRATNKESGLPAPHTKTRQVTLRLAQIDYESVKRACAEQGCRSVSEFARRAVLSELMRAGRANRTISDDLRTITLRLLDLDMAMKDVRERIAKLLGPEKASEPGAE